MKRSTKDAHIKTFIVLAIALRWLTYLRSTICRSEGYTEQLTDASRKVVSFVGDSFLTREDVNDNRARVALRNLLSASAEDGARAERCLGEVGFPEPCTQLAVLCGTSVEIQRSWQDIYGSLNIIADILSARLTEIAVALYRDNELEEAYISLKERLLENGDTLDRTERLIAQVRREISTKLKTLNII